MTDIASPHVPVSWGELLDKITILEIKRTRIDDPAAREHVVTECDLLRRIGADAMARGDIAVPLAQLKAVNEELWEIEDAIREQEAQAAFGSRFVGLARAVYHKNDERAALKRAINDRLGSALVEEKSYKGGTAAPAVAEARR